MAKKQTDVTNEPTPEAQPDPSIIVPIVSNPPAPDTVPGPDVVPPSKH